MLPCGRRKQCSMSLHKNKNKQTKVSSKIRITGLYMLGNLLKALVVLFKSGVINFVRITFLVGPQIYCCLGAVNMKFTAIRTVLFEVPAAPTVIWNELAKPGFKTPPLQQFEICWL